MTYKNPEKFLSAEKSTENTAIFIVGNGAANSSCFLSSIMRESGIEGARYISAENLELKDRFLVS